MRMRSLYIQLKSNYFNADNKAHKTIGTLVEHNYGMKGDNEIDEYEMN